MQTRHKFLLIVGGTLLAASLGWLSVRIELSLIDLSARSGFGFFGAGMLYVFVPIVAGFLGFLLCIALIGATSLKRAILYSLPFSLITSIGYMKDAFLMLTEGRFDKTYFQVDIFTICSNFVIYPLVAFLFWKAKERLTKGYQ